MKNYQKQYQNIQLNYMKKKIQKMLLKNIIHIWIKHKKLLIMKLECIFN